MNQAVCDKQEFNTVARRMLFLFLERFSTETFRLATGEALERLLSRPDLCKGNPGESVGALVYLIDKHGRNIGIPGYPGVPLETPGFLNHDLEELFGTSMTKIRKQANDDLWNVAYPVESRKQGAHGGAWISANW